MSKPFPCGIVLDRTTLYLDGTEVEVTKYINDNTNVLFHCEELHASYNTIEALLIAWIARKHLGLNQHALVSGICKALGVEE
jgi:hypothetical protein